MAIFPITDFAEALLAEIAKENEPVGYIQNGKLQWNTNGGPDKWRKRKDYTGAIYAYPPSTEHIENRVAEACAVLAETPVSGEQDDINRWMDSGAGLFIFIGIIFLAWLMWSSKSDKEVFLFYAWVLMIGGGTLYYIVKFAIR